MTIKRPIVYTKDKCQACKAVKRYLNSKNIIYIEKNITTDSESKKFLQSQNYTTVPIVISENLIIKGFKPNELNKLINI